MLKIIIFVCFRLECTFCQLVVFFVIFIFAKSQNQILFILVQSLYQILFLNHKKQIDLHYKALQWHQKTLPDLVAPEFAQAQRRVA